LCGDKSRRRSRRRQEGPPDDINDGDLDWIAAQGCKIRGVIGPVGEQADKGAVHDGAYEASRGESRRNGEVDDPRHIAGVEYPGDQIVRRLANQVAKAREIEVPGKTSEPRHIQREERQRGGDIGDGGTHGASFQTF